MTRQRLCADLARPMAQPMAAAGCLGRSAAAAIEPLDLQQQLFAQWQQCQEVTIDWPSLRRSWRPIQQSFEALPQMTAGSGFASALSKPHGPKAGQLPAVVTGRRWPVDLPGGARGAPSNNHPVGVVLSPGVRPPSQSVIQG